MTGAAKALEEANRARVELAAYATDGPASAMFAYQLLMFAGRILNHVSRGMDSSLFQKLQEDPQSAVKQLVQRLSEVSSTLEHCGGN
jgi:hypothetical protein